MKLICDQEKSCDDSRCTYHDGVEHLGEERSFDCDAVGRVVCLVPVVPEYVRVTGCPYPGFWYSNKIGEVYRVKPRKSGRDYGIVDSCQTIRPLDCEPCEAPDNHELHVRLHQEYERKLKEPRMKYTQKKPISLEKLWDAQTDKEDVEFLKEWAVFMNWTVLALEPSFFGNWDKEQLDVFFKDMKDHDHGTTWLSFMERHGFIEKEFEPFDVVLRVEHKESAVSLLVDKIRIPSGSFWGMDIRDQLKAHGIEP